MNPIEKIERNQFSVIFYANGITELWLKDNSIVNLEVSKEQESILLSKKPEKGHLLLVVAESGTNVTKESREYSNANPMDNRAMAIITKSLPQKIVVNFMITVYRKMRPKYPVKMFLKKENAVEWLLSHP